MDFSEKTTLAASCVDGIDPETIEVLSSRAQARSLNLDYSAPDDDACLDLSK
jgi:hypothetical protein